MKTFVVCLLAIVLFACNNEKKPADSAVTGEDGKTTKLDPVPLQDMAEKTAALQKLTPYTTDQLKALLPETLAGNARTKFSANNMMGVAFAEGEYKLNDSSQVELHLFDCAGSAGTGIYASQYTIMLDIQSESDDEHMKTIDLNGGKAVETVNKRNNRNSLRWFAADRLVVILEGRKISIDELKQIAASLKF